MKKTTRLLNHILFLFTLAFMGFNMSAQSIVIKGRVMEKQLATGIANASIALAAHNNYVLSDTEGFFELEVVSESKDSLLQLVVSFPGYVSSTVTIEKKDVTKVMDLKIYLVSNYLQVVTVTDRQSGLDSRSPFNLNKISISNSGLSGNPGGLMGHISREPGIYGAELGQGIVKPFIRGLGFSRVVTLYQHNKLENHQWGADHGLGLNDLGIGEMQIIKGPVSVLYGSGAVGGVLIANDDETHLGKTGWSGTMGLSFQSVSLGMRPTLSLAYTSPKRYFFKVDAALESHADYKDGTGRIIGNSRFNTQSIRMHTGIDRKNFKNKLSFTYHSQQLGIINEDEMIDSLSQATFRSDRSLQAPLQRVKDALLTYKQEQTIGNWNVYLALSQHLNNRNELEEDLQSIDLGLLQWHTFFSFRMSKLGKKDWRHTIGTQASYISTQNKENAAEILLPDARTREGGLFYLVSKNHKKIFYQGSARVDMRVVTADASAPVIRNFGFVLPGNPLDYKLDRSFNGFTGSMGLTYKHNDLHTFKFNLAGGYRAPDISELFSNGNHPGTNRFERGNTQFKREQNLQLEGTWQYKLKNLSVDASLFTSQLFNYISFVNTGNKTTNNWEIWEFIQQDAWLSGGEARFKYQFADKQKTQVNGSFSIIRAFEKSAKLPLTFIPPDNFRIQLLTQVLEKRPIKLGAECVAIDAHYRPGFGEVFTPGYLLCNLHAEKNFKIGAKSQLKTTIRIANAFNQKVIDHMSMLRAFGVPGAGRNIAINLIYLF
jgi:iron complex outermembrane receptor protein